MTDLARELTVALKDNRAYRLTGDRTLCHVSTCPQCKDRKWEPVAGVRCTGCGRRVEVSRG